VETRPMDEAIRQKILSLLDQHRSMTLATLRPDAWPQATTVGYANDDLTGPEMGLGMFGDRAQLLIDLIEQRRDKIAGGSHRLLHSWQGCTLATSVEERRDHDNKADKYYCVDRSARD